MIRLLGILAVILAISPIFGLVGLLINPPEDPLGGQATSIGVITKQSGLWILLKNSILLSSFVALTSTAIGGWLAWVERRSQYPGKELLLIGSLLPLAIPSYILAATFSSVGIPDFLSNLGLPGNSGLAPAALCLCIVCIPYSQLTISSALSRVSSAEEEAALNLGASNWRAFRVGTWPQISSAFSFSFLIAFLYTISDFGAVATLNVPVLTWRLFQAVQDQNLPKASILAITTLAATLPIFIVAHYIQGRNYLNKIANPKPPRTLQLSTPSLLCTYVLQITIIGFGILLPVWELLQWVLDGWNRGLPFVSQWEAIIDSLWAASIGALLTISLVIAPAWLSKNRPIYKYATFLSSALPGVLLAFGLMALTLQITSHTGGYGVVLSSGALLFLGYAMRFMSEAFGPISAATLQLNPKLAESAKSLNRYPGLWIRKVVIPHIKPSIATAYLIVFLACIKELPITLLLGGSTGLRTLAFRTWDRYNEALLHDAGLSGLSLIGIALIMTIITLRWRRHA